MPLRDRSHSGGPPGTPRSPLSHASFRGVITQRTPSNSHLPCLLLSRRSSVLDCASHANAQAARGDAGDAGAPGRSLLKSPGSSSPPRQLSCPHLPPAEKQAQTPRGRLPATSPPGLWPASVLWASLPVCQGTGERAGRNGPRGQSPSREGPRGSSMWALTFELLYGPHVGVIRQKRGTGRP